MAKPIVITTGTDPSSRLGGIAVALPGYFRALDIAGIEWIFIPTHHPLERGGRWKLLIKALPKLVSTIWFHRKHGHRIVVYAHAGAGISLLRQFVVLLVSRLLGAYTLLQLHALEITEYLQHAVQHRLFRLAVTPTLALGVLTPWWRQYLSDCGIRKPLFVIPNPLPLEWEQIAKKHKRLPKKGKENKVRLLTLTRLEACKGVDLIIEAMFLLPENFHLVVAGDGSMLSDLEKLVARLGLGERVRMVGWVGGNEKERLFEESDIFVLPTKYDSFGMVFLEAMANGLPIVAFSWGAIPDVVADGVCGILVKEDTPVALAKGILSLQDVSVRHEMGKKAKQWVLEEFSAKVVAERLKSAMRGALE